MKTGTSGRKARGIGARDSVGAEEARRRAGWGRRAPLAGDLGLSAEPPLRGKAHPPREMDEAVPSLDDEVALYHHPRDEGASGFGFDPDAADAAADLAGDLGATFLSGATRGEDMSDLVMSAEGGEDELPLVLDEGIEESPPEAPAWSPLRRRFGR